MWTVLKVRDLTLNTDHFFWEYKVFYDNNVYETITLIQIPVSQSFLETLDLTFLLLYNYRCCYGYLEEEEHGFPDTLLLGKFLHDIFFNKTEF